MSIDKLCDALVPLLVKEVLANLAKQPADSPLSRLKLWYYDTCAPSCYYLVEGLTEAQRSQLLVNEGRNALYEIWDGGSGIVEFTIGLEAGSSTEALLARVYDFMCSDEGDESLQGHEGRRTVAQRVAAELNSVDLSGTFPITDDFIAYAQNGTDYGCDTYEDLCASVPESKLELLRSRGLMGPGEKYDERPGYQGGEDPTLAEQAHRWSEHAEYIAAYFSWDARQWPNGKAANRPLRVSFIFENPAPWYVGLLRQAWSDLLSIEYSADNGKALALTRQDQEPDATILFREERHPETKEMGLAYELSFPPSHDIRPGWFRLEE